MDEIIITGIACKGYHGCLPEERVKGQPFIVDLALRLDLKDAGLTDDLQRTIDYGEVCNTVVAIVEGKPFNLIESLAYAIVGTVFSFGFRCSYIAQTRSAYRLLFHGCSRADREIQT